MQFSFRHVALIASVLLGVFATVSLTLYLNGGDKGKPPGDAQSQPYKKELENFVQFYPPRTVPDISFDLLLPSGEVEKVGLARFKDEVLVVNFWATWCAPCVAELPALSRAAAALADDGIVVMLVSIDRGGAAKAVPFLERLGVTGLRLGFDPKAKLSREVGIRGLPTSLLLTSSQDKAWRFVGPFEWDSEDMLALIRDLAAR